MQDEDELLDLVDADDSVIGTIARSQKASLKTRGFLRASEMFVQNSSGQLWVPRRQKHKTIAPGGLDYSASGHIGAGESYAEGLAREVEEELNLKINPKCLRFIHKFPPTGAEKMFFRSVYVYHSDNVPRFNPEDFSEYYWLTPQELLSKLEGGEPAKRSLQETVRYLIDYPAAAGESFGQVAGKK